MEKLITKATESFSGFLKENDSFLKSRIPDNLLVSFIFDCGDFNCTGKIDENLKNSPRAFYFEQPEKNYMVFGIDDVLNITESGDGRFAITEKKLKEWKGRILSNRDNFQGKRIPLFVGGMKFTVEHPGNEWKDFHDSTWFVPGVMFFRNGSDNFLVLNLHINSKKTGEYIVNQFRARLENILKQNLVTPAPLPSLKKIDGNTPKDRKKWKQMISGTLEKIGDNKIQKVVLARKVEMILSSEPNLEKIILTLNANYPECAIFLFRQNNSTFFGATPETLCRFSGELVEVDALAGSAPRGKSEIEDNELEKKLLASEKDIAEHNFVVEHIKNSLSGFSSKTEIKNDLSIKKFSNIQHLYTQITARPDAGYSMFNILKEIYPTPAVCGSPKDSAQQIIKKSETFERGLYSGIIGFFNFDNEAEFVVALRSALSTGTRMIAYAGSGIVANSDPDEEFSETELKLKPVMTLFRNEN